ncbi:uncharacterized protein LOC120127042 [Hibiscus syriacus]|uniref:uncharacterized protein LOC120127042 n=1 Tax=Hibiscus syriacus TaxID=106335 RepID=UPI00192397C8|nr:uncharacterized protein LOC120127042 [Hibiscus syriacus]
MSRLLTFANIRKSTESAISNQRSNQSVFRKYATVVTVVSPLPKYRLCIHYRFNGRGNVPLSLQNRKEGFGRGYFARNHSFLSVSSAVTHLTQVAWKRLARKCSASGRTFPHINRAAQAVSLALSRSHLIVPGIFGLTCGR